MRPSSSTPGQSEIRHAARCARAQLSDRKRRDAAIRIADQIFLTDIYRRAKTIGCYLPLDTEVSTWPVIERAWHDKKRIFAPVTKKNRLLLFREFVRDSEVKTHKWGMQEPIDGQIMQAEKLDLVIAPMVAFDGERNRIGMGGGYYDRAFSFIRDADHTLKPVLIGFAFDCQQVEKITPNPWDIRLFSVFTESGEV